jgi:hypothetical protein
MARISSAEHSDALNTLRQWIPSGSTVFTILRHVSCSGMRREIGLVVFPRNTLRPIHPNYHAARALGLSLGKRDGVIMNGCGMDMGFDAVYRLGLQLYGDG